MTSFPGPGEAILVHPVVLWNIQVRIRVSTNCLVVFGFSFSQVHATLIAIYRGAGATGAAGAAAPAALIVQGHAGATGCPFS